MKLKDISHGSHWNTWFVFALLLTLSIVLLSGHGANLIAGYNTSSKEEKRKYDEKKLCKIAGTGLLVISVLILIMIIFEIVLPAYAAYVFLGIVLADVVVMIVLMNTICKK